MNKVQTALLVLLRAGLWERKIEDLACFPLSAGEWKSLYLLARQQTVTGIVFQGVQHLPENFLPADELLVRWMAETDAIERKNMQMNRVLESLVQWLAERGVHPVLQKGQGIARLYENPLLRECGDIDLYFDSSQMFEKAFSLVRQSGLQEKVHADRSVVYAWKGVEVEHHIRLLDVHNPFLQGYVKALEQKYGYGHMSLKGGQDVRIPSPMLNLLLQSLHILKHALGWGIGLRQLCDMARSCYRLHDEVEPDEIKEITLKLGMGRWQQLLHAFLAEQLGLPLAYLPYQEVASDSSSLLDIIWRGGNFGQFVSGYQRKPQSPLAGKWQTARAFQRNVRFAFRYAPKEGFWVFSSLLKGQLK